MIDFGSWSLLPPFIAIFLAIRTKQVILSLGLGLFSGYLIINSGNPVSSILSTLNAIIAVFESAGNTRTVLFTLLIGALIALIKHAGGVNGFIRFAQSRIAKSKRPESKLQLAAAFTGVLIFIESNISILTVGTIFKPLFAKYRISKEKLAYLADSSSAPACILIPLNAWGAYIMGLLAIYDNISPVEILVASIPLNFYAILTLVLVFGLAYKNKSYGPMKSYDNFEDEAFEGPENTLGNAKDMVLPLLVMILTMPAFLLYTGWENIDGSLSQKIWNAMTNGSGSAAVFYAVFSSLLFSALWLGLRSKISLKGYFEQSIKGMAEMLEMAILMVMAFAIGDLCRELGTGQYVASVSAAWLSPTMAPALLFIISSFIAFSTGTSWGTFAIMLSIAVPLAQAIGLHIPLAVAAVLGGGVFGDHCSPISDTTLIASMASGSDHIDHVRTQLPYALFTGGIAVLFYLLAGFLF